MKKSRNGTHSTGAVYLTIANNPRGKRNRPEETMLVVVIAGPSEPTQEQLNRILEPMVNDLRKLYMGEVFHTF